MALRFPHIAFSLTVRDLGLTLDHQLTFAPHINRLCRDCYYQLRPLRVISRSLSRPLQLLLLSTPLSHLGFITAPHSTLVSLLSIWAASSGLSALPRASFLKLDTYLGTCLMYSTGCPSSSG